MARRIQLADVADGITGHVIRDTPWDKVWPLSGIARGVRDGLGTEYHVDLATGEVTPASRELTTLAAGLRSDLARHLQARRLPAEWVGAATLTVAVGVATIGSQPIPVTCRVVITDDLGRPHTSTRRGTIPQLGSTPLSRLVARFLPRR